MDTIISVRTAIRTGIKGLLGAALLFGLSPYVLPGPGWNFTGHLLAVAVFLMMEEEDSKDSVIDIRHAAVFFLLYATVSQRSLSGYLSAAAITFVAFRILYLCCILRINPTSTKEKTTNRKRVQLPLLPSVFFSLAVISGFNLLNPDILAHLKIFRDEGFLILIETLEASGILMSFLIPYLAVWLYLEYKFWKIPKEERGEESLGMGDVYVLPTFAGLFGFQIFYVMLLFTCMAHFIRALLKKKELNREL